MASGSVKSRESPPTGARVFSEASSLPRRRPQQARAASPGLPAIHAEWGQAGWPC